MSAVPLRADRRVKLGARGLAAGSPTPRLSSHIIAPMRSRQFGGMRGFALLWSGQLVSALGSSLTSFAITIWAFQETGQATTLALVGLFAFGPSILVGPLAGALVDRWNRKLVTALSDVAAAIATAVLFALHATGTLEVWHLYLLGAWSGVFGAFQWPATSALISLLVPKEQYGRTAGLMSLIESAPLIVAPFLAALILAAFGLSAVLLIDMATCALAVASLAFIRVPQVQPTGEQGQVRPRLGEELVFGFKYIAARRGLLGLMLMFAVVNLVSGMTGIMSSATVLARTGNDAVALGSVQSLAGVGGLAGGLLLGVWGGPRVKVYGVFACLIASGLLGTVVFAAGRTLPLMMLGAFVYLFCVPILNGCSQAIWQSKVAPAVQGKVFTARRMLAQALHPISLLVAGPLADRVLEPAMSSPSASRLAEAFGPVVGTGAGAGMALLLLASGLLLAAAALVGILNPRVRNVEAELSDHDADIRPAGKPASVASST